VPVFGWWTVCRRGGPALAHCRRGRESDIRGGRSDFETAVPMEIGNAATVAFSQRFECKNDGSRYEEPERGCFRLTIRMARVRVARARQHRDFDLDLVIPDKEKTLNEGAIEP